MKKFFYHEDMINMLKKYFPLYLQNEIEKKYNLKSNITIEELSVPYVTGSGDGELKISENVIKISGKKDVRLTYEENVVSAELVVKIEGNSIGSIKKMDELNLVKSISRAVIDEFCQV